MSKGTGLKKLQAFRGLAINRPPIKLKNLCELANLLSAVERLAGKRFNPVGGGATRMTRRIEAIVLFVDPPQAFERFGMVHKGEQKVAGHAGSLHRMSILSS
jgi:hypothetical protein